VVGAFLRLVGMKNKQDRIRELRATGLSLFEAKRIVEKQDLDIEIRDAKTIDDIRAILWTLAAR
jgi:ribosomal protein L7/L12